MTREEIAKLQDKELADSIYDKMLAELHCAGDVVKEFGCDIDSLRNICLDFAADCDYLEYFDLHWKELDRNILEMMAGVDEIFPFLREFEIRWDPDEKRVGEAFNNGIRYMQTQIEAYKNAIED